MPYVLVRQMDDFGVPDGATSYSRSVTGTVKARPSPMKFLSVSGREKGDRRPERAFINRTIALASAGQEKGPIRASRTCSHAQVVPYAGRYIPRMRLLILILDDLTCTCAKIYMIYHVRSVDSTIDILLVFVNKVAVSEGTLGSKTSV